MLKWYIIRIVGAVHMIICLMSAISQVKWKISTVSTYKEYLEISDFRILILTTDVD